MTTDVSRPRDALASPPPAAPASALAVRRRAAVASPYVSRALALWPRLDSARLARAGDDPRRIAALVARRSSLPVEVIAGMLAGPAVAAGPRVRSER